MHIDYEYESEFFSFSESEQTNHHPNIPNPMILFDVKSDFFT